MTVEPTDEEPKEPTVPELLKRIDAGITILVVIVLVIGGFFVYRHFEDERQRKAKQDVERFSQCIDDHIALGQPTTDCHP